MKQTFFKIKKTVSVIVAIATVTSLLTACGEAYTSQKENSAISADSAATTEVDANVEEAAGKYNLSIQKQKAVDSPEWFTKLEAAKDCEQLIVVAGVGETTCYVSMHEKDLKTYQKHIF